jgi:hypothetical protein
MWYPIDIVAYDPTLIIRFQEETHMVQAMITALVVLLIGIAFCFAGYTFFRILIPIWGFLVGFSLGASGIAIPGFLHTTPNWIAGLVVGVILAILAYLFYYVAVVLLAASIGYWIGVGVLIATGVGFSPLAVLAGIVLAVILAVLAMRLNLPKVLIVFFSALGGASAIVAGVLLLLRIIPPGSIQYGSISTIIRGSWLWSIAWLVLVIAGIATQSRSTPRHTWVSSSSRRPGTA